MINRSTQTTIESCWRKFVHCQRHKNSVEYNEQGANSWLFENAVQLKHIVTYAHYEQLSWCLIVWTCRPINEWMTWNIKSLHAPSRASHLNRIHSTICISKHKIKIKSFIYDFAWYLNYWRTISSNFAKYIKYRLLSQNFSKFLIISYSNQI